MMKQRADYDCVLTCLAMATGRDYEEMFDAAFQHVVDIAKGTGKGNLHEQAFLKAGLVDKVDYSTVYCERIPAPVVRGLLWGRRALIQVDSLNNQGAMHFVYWDGAELHDPSRKQQYRWLDHVAPYWVTLLK